MDAAGQFNSLRKCVQDIARQVAERGGSILSAKQCQDLSSKLSEAFGNIQELVFPYEASAVVAFRPGFEEFLRIVEEAKKLVEDCSSEDWVKASVFQIRNEEGFREILLKLGLCYNVIYDKAKTMSLASGRLLKVKDLRSLPQDSTCGPAWREDVLDDRQTLQRRLEEVTKNVRNSNDVILARYLLRRLKTLDTSEKFCHEGTCIMYDASTLEVSDKDLKQTWDSSTELLHHSDFSCVYKTKWLELNAAKKVWVINDDDENLAKLTDQFRREAELLASVTHPNIVKFFCWGISTEGHRKQYFIGMELMEKSLSSLIWERRMAGQSFLMQEALDIIQQIARGMLHLHDLGIAHRDFKPQNVGVSRSLCDGFFCVKLLDFGLSKTKVQVSKSNTVTHRNTGTTIYRAPEAFEYAKPANGAQKVKWFKADVYSFAVTCYQILSLQQPYKPVHGARAFFEELMSGTRPPCPAGCPETLFKLMEECWAGDPNARPNFWSICERLEKFKHDVLLQGPGAAATEGVDQLREENVVASPSSYAHIETMLKRRSELRTPAKHLAKVAENEGATSECDEGDISEGNEGAISEGGDGAISEPGVDEMEYASQRIYGGTQPSKNDLSKVRGDADQSKKDKKVEEAGMGVGSSTDLTEGSDKTLRGSRLGRMEMLKFSTSAHLSEVSMEVRSTFRDLKFSMRHLAESTVERLSRW